MRNLLFISMVAAAAIGHAQFRVESVTGSLYDQNFNTLSPGDSFDDFAVIGAEGDSASFQLTNRSVFGDDYDPYARSFVGFRAQAFNFGDPGDSISAMLPSDRIGGMSAADENEFRTFAMTGSDYSGSSFSYLFAGSLTATGSASGEIEIQSVGLGQGSPRSASALGSFSITNLDNGAWDLDPTVGNVRIDRGATPTVTLQYAVPDYDIQRDTLDLFGESFDNPFVDRYYTGVTYFIVGSTTQSIGTDFEPGGHTFGSGDMSSASIAGGTGELVIDFSSLLGNYTYFGSDVVWNWMGDDSGFLDTDYPSAGQFMNYQSYNLEVVPEPAPFMAMGLGLAVLLKKRSKR